MTAPGPAAEQLHEVVALTIDPLVSIEPVIRNKYDCCFISERTFLDSGPDLSDNRIHLLQYKGVRLRVIIMMSDVIEVRHKQIQITDLWIFQLSDELPYKLIRYHTSKFEAHGPLVKEFLRRFHKTILQTALQSRIARVSQEQRIRKVAF